MGQYFNAETDAAIAAFLASTDLKEREVIFNGKVKPALEKLIESLIFVYGFYKLGDVDSLKRECLAYVYEMLPRFDPNRGAKGFSYFNVVAKNWFIMQKRERMKKARAESELFHDLDHESVKNDPNFSVSPFEDLVESREQWIKFYEEMDSWMDELDKKVDRQVLEAVIFLMKNPQHVSIYNRKAVYLYLRELTGLNTKQVVVGLKKIKDLYEEWREKYVSTGES